MAQMAPALAETAASPSSNRNISSSSVQNPLRETYIEEGRTIDNSKLQIKSTTSHHNGFCRSMAKSNIKSSAGKRVLDESHKLNNLPDMVHNTPESTKLRKLDSQNVPLASCGENTNAREQIQPISARKETLISTPTRIPITTTKTCGSNSPRNRSSCQTSDNKTDDESRQRHLFPCPKPSPRLLLEKKVKNVGLSQARIAARCRKLERRLRTLQSRQLETHVTDQLQSFALNRRKSQQASSRQKHEQPKQDLLTQTSSQLREETSSSDTPTKSLARIGEELPSNASSGQNNIGKHSELGENNLKSESGRNISSNKDKEAEGNAARTLVCQLELAEHVGDSDATECSSGAESCDEMDFNIANTESKVKG